MVISKVDVVTAACMSRDCQIIAWVCTFAEGWKDNKVDDLQKYRTYLLNTAQKFEQLRATQVNGEPCSIPILARTLTKSIASNPRAYTFGIAVKINVEAAIESLNITD